MVTSRLRACCAVVRAVEQSLSVARRELRNEVFVRVTGQTQREPCTVHNAHTLYTLSHKKDHEHNIRNNFFNSETILIICSQFSSEMYQLGVGDLLKISRLGVIKRTLSQTFS